MTAFQNPNTEYSIVTDIPLLESVFPFANYYNDQGKFLQYDIWKKSLKQSGDLSPDNLIKIIRSRSRPLTQQINSIKGLLKDTNPTDGIIHEIGCKMDHILKMPEYNENIIMPCIFLFLYEYADNKAKKNNDKIKFDELKSQINTLENRMIKENESLKKELSNQYQINSLLDSNILDFNTKINTLENKMIKENESLKQHLSNQYQIKLDSNILDFNTKMNTLENRMIKENEYLKQQLRYQLYLFICLCILYLFHIQN